MRVEKGNLGDRGMHHLLSVRGNLHLVTRYFEETDDVVILTLFPPLMDSGPQVCKSYGYVGNYIDVKFLKSFRKKFQKRKKKVSETFFCVPYPGPSI
jgi:hypothetical protein